MGPSGHLQGWQWVSSGAAHPPAQDCGSFSPNTIAGQRPPLGKGWAKAAIEGCTPSPQSVRHQPEDVWRAGGERAAARAGCPPASLSFSHQSSLQPPSLSSCSSAGAAQTLFSRGHGNGRGRARAEFHVSCVPSSCFQFPQPLPPAPGQGHCPPSYTSTLSLSLSSHPGSLHRFLLFGGFPRLCLQSRLTGVSRRASSASSRGYRLVIVQPSPKKGRD